MCIHIIADKFVFARVMNELISMLVITVIVGVSNRIHSMTSLDDLIKVKKCLKVEKNVGKNFCCR